MYITRMWNVLVYFLYIPDSICLYDEHEVITTYKTAAHAHISPNIINIHLIYPSIRIYIFVWLNYPANMNKFCFSITIIL